MATTTPNYGWTVPTSTDLVKDGATAIETLGDAIDASLVDLRGGTTGQVLKKASATQMDFEWGTASSGLTLINTTSFSAVSSQSIGSDASPLFTSAYKNYKIVISGKGSAATTVALNIRMRANTTDDSTNNYYFWQTYRTQASGATDYSATLTGFLVGTVSGSLRTYAEVDISYPQVADYTTMTGQAIGVGSTTSEFSNVAGYKNVTTQFNGMTIYPASGTITGEVSIYGYSA
jgi:hypothetical protein